MHKDIANVRFLYILMCACRTAEVHIELVAVAVVSQCDYTSWTRNVSGCLRPAECKCEKKRSCHVGHSDFFLFRPHRRRWAQKNTHRNIVISWRTFSTNFTPNWDRPLQRYFLNSVRMEIYFHVNLSTHSHAFHPTGSRDHISSSFRSSNEKNFAQTQFWFNEWKEESDKKNRAPSRLAI